MKAYITSVGEKTTKLCEWALSRNGFDTVLIEDKNTTLQSKLEFIYTQETKSFLRVDADIIVNKNMTPQLLEKLSENSTIWWWQFIVFDWFKQDLGYSLAYIKQEAIKPLRNNISKFKDDIRPETRCSRIDEFNNPRRLETFDKMIVGLHGYGTENLEPVINLKKQRKQLDIYDFDLAKRINEI